MALSRVGSPQWFAEFGGALLRGPAQQFEPMVSNFHFIEIGHEDCNLAAYRMESASGRKVRIVYL